MLAAVKAWPGESRVWENAERRPALTASTRGVTRAGQVGTKKQPAVKQRN